MWPTTHLRYAGAWVCEAGHRNRVASRVRTGITSRTYSPCFFVRASRVHTGGITPVPVNKPRHLEHASAGANIAVQYVKMSRLGSKKPDVPKRGLWDNFSRVQDVAILKRMEMHHEHDSPNLP